MTKVKISKKLKTHQEETKSRDRKKEPDSFQPIISILKFLGIAFVISSVFHGAILKRVEAFPVQAATVINTNIYTVKKGDSLWTIVKIKYPKSNAVEIIKKIKELNNLHGDSLHTGQALKMP
jgi:LysM repeat protein